MSYTVNVTGHCDTAEEEATALAGMAAALRDLPGVESAAFSASFSGVGDLTHPDDVPPAPLDPGATPAAPPAADTTGTTPAAPPPAPEPTTPGTAPDPETGINPPPETLAEPTPVAQANPEPPAESDKGTTPA